MCDHAVEEGTQFVIGQSVDVVEDHAKVRGRWCRWRVMEFVKVGKENGCRGEGRGRSRCERGRFLR